MLRNDWSTVSIWLRLGILMIAVLVVHTSCKPETTYSVEEQYHLYATRLPTVSNQLEFSFKFTPDRVPVGQDIFFAATFTNTMDQSIVLRKPEQQGIIEKLEIDTTLLFTVERISTTIPFQYPLEHRWPLRLVPLPAERHEFVTLPPQRGYEVRLKLPNLVIHEDTEDVIFLPPGQYRIHMTYDNSYIGYKIELDSGETRYIDLGAWVGKVEASPALLTITP